MRSQNLRFTGYIVTPEKATMVGPEIKGQKILKTRKLL